ncbi:hypothetical protein B0A48_01389 [Cryoendolithus antarcticus]|uniref:DNA polymerase alpha subunit B n=1 Tax=Cryoendolithus antarcticus TaxID=1507870 RepID=A0A1V8TT68_9PEZI|nr:hypothetical protein B0A48_01389 [Cryoendolithus antarcticus]
MADDSSSQLHTLFSPHAPLPSDVLHELLSLTSLLSLTPEELFYKWESYAFKMGTETTLITYKTVKDFKKDLQDALERESRAKAPHASVKRAVAATPRGAARGNGDVFGMMEGLTPGSDGVGSGSARGGAKRKAGELSTPSGKVVKSNGRSPPTGAMSRADGPVTSFAERQNAGQVVETLNGHLTSATTAEDEEPRIEKRVLLKANTEIPKFAYKSMAMQLTSASEILDDRIDTFTELVQDHHKLPDSAFGNPAAQSTAEIVAVGRIACDQPTGKLNAASITLETSRRMGAGLRAQLKFQSGVNYDVFPGKIVALRGTNVNGEAFLVSEVLSLPLLPPAASTPSELSIHQDRSTSATGNAAPLQYLIASGPYTPDTDLSFAALHTLLDLARTQQPDILLLTGPFLDLEHPLLASGDLEPHLPTSAHIDPDRATLNDVFRALISVPLQQLCQAVPTITIILVPSVRDAISTAVSWPQDRFAKGPLGLPKQVQVVTNPITLSVNETVLGISSQDIFSELRRENVKSTAGGLGSGEDMLARLAGQVIEQRHFFPVFPPQAREALPALSSGVEGLGGDGGVLPIGAGLDIGFLKLGEWLSVRPDVLVLPSALPAFAKVVDSVLVINPGTLSKRRGAGTYASLSLHPRSAASDEEREANHVLGHEVHSRARVDVVRI